MFLSASEIGDRARVCIFISKKLGEYTYLVYS